MFSFQNIYHAYMACRKNKRNTINQLDFEINLLDNLWNLQDALESKTYKIGKSLCFLTSSPKLREIFASDFKDRIVHHVLVKELEPFYEKRFIDDVYNNRKNKGIHKAIKKAKKYMNATHNGYYLQLDIKGFFYNIDKNILFMKIFNDIQDGAKAPLPNGTVALASTNDGAKAPFPRNMKIFNDISGTVALASSVSAGAEAPFPRKEILWLANKIIYHDPTRNYSFKGDKSKLALLPNHKTLFKIPKSKGLPIGNLSSQFFANVYMNDFDKFIKRNLKVKHYIRYVDDFVLFDTSKERLQILYGEIKNYLNHNLKLELRSDSKLKKYSDGLDFLGYVIRENYILTRRRVINNYKYKKANYLQNYENQKGNMSLEEIKKFLSVQASFVSHIKHSNSFNLMNKVGKIDDESNPFDFDRFK